MTPTSSLSANATRCRAHQCAWPSGVAMREVVAGIGHGSAVDAILQ